MLYGDDSISHGRPATFAPPVDDGGGQPLQQGGRPLDKAAIFPMAPGFFSTTTGKLVLAAGAAGVLFLLYKKMSRGGGAAAAPKS